MDRQRRLEILSYCKEWENTFNDMTIKDCFFALYDFSVISSKELDYLIDWITL